MAQGSGRSGLGLPHGHGGTADNPIVDRIISKRADSIRGAWGFVQTVGARIPRIGVPTDEGPFAEGGSGFLGFAIEDQGLGESVYRYGWIGVAWDPSAFELTIDGFAYETDAGVGIAAGAIPAPGALGLFGFAAGAAGIRRKRQV